MDELIIPPSDLAEILGVSPQYVYKMGWINWTSKTVTDYMKNNLESVKEKNKEIHKRLREYNRSAVLLDISSYTITAADKKRFESKVSIGNDSECWNWTASTVNGYGSFRFRHKKINAHRFSYWLYNGEYPTKSVCHSCDNKLCVNPKHLFLCTQQENMTDLVRKRRKGTMPKSAQTLRMKKRNNINN